MRVLQPLVLASVLVLATLGGCLAAEEPKATSDSASPTSSASGSTAPSPTPTSGGPEPVAPIANLTLNVTNGSLPLSVSFAILDDSGSDQTNISWTLDFGDGNSTNGTTLPGRTNYTYETNGTFEVLLNITTDSGESGDNETITVEGASAVPPPSQLVYESGPVVGYVSEGGYDHCPAYLVGPGEEQGLGLWIELEPGHVGMAFTTTGTAGGDSDGWLFAEPDGAPLSVNINNGGGEAEGVIPPEAKWMLIVSWATPSDNMVVTFAPAS